MELQGRLERRLGGAYSDQQSANSRGSLRTAATGGTSRNMQS